MPRPTEVAHQAQTNVIKALSQQIWGSEWLVLDEYGDSDGRLERTLAGKLIDALHDKAFKWHEDHGEGLCDDCRAIVERVKPKEDTTETYRKQRALKPIEHGTRTGFQAHKRRNDTPCEDCKQANRDYNNRLRLAKNPELKPRGKARATSARVKVEKPARRRQTHSDERATSARPNARPVEVATNGFRPIDLMPEALFMLLPNPGETFTEEAKKRWLAFATLTLDLVWPNE